MKNETKAAGAWTIRIAMNHRGGEAEREAFNRVCFILAVPIRRPLNTAEKEEEKTNVLSKFFCSFCFSPPFCPLL